MEVSLTVLRQLVIMCIYMLVGWLLKKTSLITSEGSKSMTNLFIYAVCPAVMVSSFFSEGSPEKDKAVLLSFLGAALVLGLSMLLSRIFCHRDAVEEFGVAFSNAGFIGVPLVITALGSGRLLYATGVLALLAVLQWTYGQDLLTGKHSTTAKVLLVNPVVIPFMLGLLIYFLRIPLPGLLKETVGAIAELNAPLAMIILGVYLAEIPFRSILTEPWLWVCCLLRLIVIPAATLVLLLVLFRGHKDIAEVLLVMSSAPAGANTAVYAGRLGKDYHHAVRLVCLSTVLAVVTLPSILFLWDILA